MSIPLYDKAIADKIKSWILDPNMTILYPDESTRFFQQTADENKDIIKLPLISISRDRTIDIKLKNKRYAEYQGKTFNSTGYSADGLKHIPIILKYQIDIYTRYREEADEYARNFIFNIIDYPELTIDIPYKDCGLVSTSYMELDNSILDNSDVPERIISGLFTRVTLGVTLKDAQLYSYSVKPIPKVVSAEIKGSLAVSAEIGNNNHSIGDECETLVEEIDLTREINTQNLKGE